jgi:hypothetical protein
LRAEHNIAVREAVAEAVARAKAEPEDEGDMSPEC